MSHYIQYYEDQVGEGRGVRHVFSGATYQRGSGIGSFLGSIFRKIVPYIARGAKAVGKEAVRTGLNVFDDVANNGSSFKESFNDRMRESGKNLGRKAVNKLSEMMDGGGGGYKPVFARNNRQSKRSRPSTKKSKGKKKSSKNSGASVKKKKSGASSSSKGKKKKAAVRSVTDIFGSY